MADLVRWRNEWWEAYRAHNERFAREIAQIAAPGDLVWVHDYHLLLVSEMLAVERPDVNVGLSIHTPIDATALAGLPMAAELAEALTAPALIGVQTKADRAELATFCPRRRRGTVVSPASIDPAELTALANGRATRALVERLRTPLDSRLLVAGVDRIDHTKAIPQRIHAIDRAFRQGYIRPDDVEIIQIAQPSRTGLIAYRELRLEVERRAHDVASNWLRSDGTSALRVVTEGRDRRYVAALLGAADIAMVTPIRDGMNLVAKEFSIYNEQRAGVLVLGEGAGAADELGDGSVLVDGGDPTSIADGIARAVALGEPARRDKARRRADAVRAWTSEHWAADFERRLARANVSIP
jgi:trehalose 6-phosphate synthase